METSHEDEMNTTPVSSHPMMTQRERNQLLVNHSQYNYLYIVGSEVFHRRDCKVCLNASSHTRILGSVYYRSAVKNRRPCKICKPVPDLLLASNPEKEIIKAKLLTGEVIEIQRGHILGWCHNIIHPGAVNKALLDKHNCLGKNCRFFERNTQSHFWPSYMGQKQSKINRRKERKLKKQKKALEASELLILADQWRSLLKEIDCTIQLVRVAKDTPNTYRIFYVSDNNFNDRSRYSFFLETLESQFPGSRFILRHIRDLDGHFVTREEYSNRRKK